MQTNFCNPSAILSPGVLIENRGSDGFYVRATNNGTGPLKADAPTVTGSEKFQIMDLGNGKIAIKAFVNNKYICADNAGVSPLIANGTSCGTWETFQKIDAGSGHVFLKSLANNKYVCADNAGKSPLIANRDQPGNIFIPREVTLFKLVPQP